MTNSTKSKKSSKNHHPDATDELKESLVETAHAVGHTAELLASDVKLGALNTGKSVKERAVDLKNKATGATPEPPVKPKSHVIAKAAAGTAIALAVAGIVITLLRQQQAETEETA
ncbi:MAG: hypothetical protein ACRD0P_21530 [Stackebrandtia sp.]